MGKSIVWTNKVSPPETWVSEFYDAQSRNMLHKETDHSAPNLETSLSPPRYRSMGDQSSVIDYKPCMYSSARQGNKRYLNLLRSPRQSPLQETCTLGTSMRFTPRAPGAPPCWAGIMIEAREEYLNLKRKNTSGNNGSCAGKNLDGSNALNDANILQRLFSDILNVYVNTLRLDTRYQIISHIQRISLEVLERYMNIDEGCSSEMKDLVEDKAIFDITNVSWTWPPTKAFVSSRGKKYKDGFLSIIDDFIPHCIFPEGLLLAQSLFCAKASLEFYNDKHGTDYKLVEPLSSSRNLESVLRFHCNFTASKVNENGSWTRPKLFFGTFLLWKRKIVDIRCKITDPAKAYYMCCEFCVPDLAHSSRAMHHSEVYYLIGGPKEFKGLKNKIHAKMALDFFNKKHGTKFKLVKSLESNILPVRFGVYKFHCNFKAKLENPGSSESDDDSSKKYLFFGDIVKSFHSTEGDCYILENTEDSDDHCSICRKGILHPAHYRK